MQYVAGTLVVFWLTAHFDAALTVALFGIMLSGIWDLIVSRMATVDVSVGEVIYDWERHGL